MIGWTIDDIKQIIGVLEQATSFTAANIPGNEAPYEKALKFLLERGIVDIVAGDVDYINITSGLTAANVQEALDELDALLDILKANEKVITYYEVVSGASSGDAINVPTSGTILLDRFGSSEDAILSRVDGNNIPTYESPRDVTGNVVTASLALDGTYIFSSTPTDVSLALIYTFKISANDYHYVDINFVINETELTPSKASQIQVGTEVGNGGTTTDAYITPETLRGKGYSMIKRIAGEVIPSHRAVVIVSDKLWLFNHTTPSHYGRVIGISYTSGIIGDIVEVITDDEVTLGIPLVDGSVYFATSSGLSATAPTTGIVQKIGIATSSAKMLVDISTPIQKS